MPSQEELDAEYSGSDLEAKVRRLESTVNGLMESGLDRLLASGYLQFEGIPLRWNKYGMQVKSGTNPTIALSILNELVASEPTTEYPRASFGGFTDGDSGTAYVQGLTSGTNYASIAADANASNVGSRTDLVAGSASAYAYFLLGLNSSIGGYLELNNARLQLNELASDPGAIADGGLYYYNDKLYARINGATVELGATGGGGVGIVTNPFEWQGAWGHDFRFNAGNADLITTAAAANPSGLSGHGWVATALSVTEGSSGDFLSSSDLDPTRIVWNAASDSLVSPRIFGSYDHMLIAAESLGATPTKLCCEVFAAWTTKNFTETLTFFGFVAPGTTDAAAAGSAAAITTDNANFYLKSDNGSDTGAASDTAWHRWRIEVSSSTTEWFIDNVSQGTITTETDIWPTSFKAFTTNNRFDIAWFRVYYE